MDKQTMVYYLNRILPNKKMEHTVDICYSLDKFQRNYVE